MKTSQKGISLIKSYEACKLKAYQYKGDIATIGWGSTRYEDGTPVHLGEEITQERADQLFLNTLTKFEAKVSGLLTGCSINQNQFDALVSFAYNLGWGALGDSTLLKKVKKNPKDPSIEAEFLKWVSPGTQFTNGLKKRRQAESDLYFT